MNQYNRDIWALSISYTSQCVCCFEREEVSENTPDAAVTSLQARGWVVHDIGPWCPDCAPHLRSRQKESFHVGDVVKEGRDTLGPILRVATGYVEVRLSHGGSCLCLLDTLTKG